MIGTVAALAFAFVGWAGIGSETWAHQTAQTSKLTTNADVVAMASAKLSDEVIIAAFQNTPTDFDVSPPALIALKTAGVSDRVIQAMQAATSAKSIESKKAGASGADGVSRDSCRVFITEDDPPSAWYTVAKKEVKAGKKFYGSHDDALMTELATLADKVGADAIIGFHEWRAPSAFSWAAAKAGGMAVKWTADGKGRFSTLKGQCWAPKGKL